MSAGEQTPTELRRDQMIRTPMDKRRLADAGGLPAGCGEHRFREGWEAHTIGLALFHPVAAAIYGDKSQPK